MCKLHVRDIVHLKRRRNSDVDQTFDPDAKFVVVGSDGPLLRCQHTESGYSICELPCRFELVNECKK